MVGTYVLMLDIITLLGWYSTVHSPQRNNNSMVHTQGVKVQKVLK